MKKTWVSLFPVLFMFGVWQAHAEEAWTASRTIEPGETIQRNDVDFTDITNPTGDVLRQGANPVGMDARRRILVGKPLVSRDIEPHMLIKANMPVHVIWQSGSINMQLQAKALQPGAAGDQIRVLNTSSSRTLEGTVLPDGSVQVGN